MSTSITHAHATTPLTKIILLALVWLPIIGVVSAIALLWNRWVNWVDLTLFLTMYTVCAFGITLGFHRMLTHKAFQAHPWVKTFFLISGSMAMQGPALHWAATHTQHHANSDEEDDPHSPLKSLWHAHVGWILNDFKPDIQKYAGAMLKDPIIVFVHNTFWLWVFVGLAIPSLIGAGAAYLMGQSAWFGALTGLIWGGFVRLFFNQHVTWAVNSICHTFGSRQFETTDESRNNFLFGILAMGEGWHNNHHAFPRSARHGMNWKQPDPSAWAIWLMEKLGLIKDVVLISRKRIEARLRAEPDPTPDPVILPIPAEQRD
ncbi:MAG: acyl-CoA desaturase [Verrucomicrobia bacterium]|nr:acyl-CoA desaturase [Verrucomicrobiota bacterium]